MELCTFCDMRTKEYLEGIEPFEDRFRITKAETKEFYKIYREMSEQGKGDFYTTQKIIRAKYPSFHKYKAIDAFIYLFLAEKVEDVNKLYVNVGSPSEFKDELIGGERSGINPQECREFVLAKLQKEIARR